MRTLVTSRLGFVAALAAAAAAATAVLLHGTAPGKAAPLSSARVDLGVVDVNTRFGLQSGGGAGTGILLSSSGLVLTNNHVIRGATAIRVTDVATGHTYSARVVGYSFSADVAVLRISRATGLKSARIGDSTSVRVGDRVTAVGNAGGTGGKPSVTGGRVKALSRSLRVRDERGGSELLTGLFETSTALQPGDSGGPLLNGAGRVIGIDTAASFNFQFQARASAGFAIPINRALAIARQIEAGRSSATVHVGPTAFLGVEVSPPAQAGQGALVEAVVSGSAADKAGLVRGDVITAANGRRITSPTALTRLMTQVAPGSKLRLRWIDQGGHAHSAVARPRVGPPQ